MILVLPILIYLARVSELVDDRDSKSRGGNPMRVRVPPRVLNMSVLNKKNLAYVIGVALGDGNLSNPNKRAVRLRVTCDTKYPNLIKKISSAIQELLPNNKVSIINSRETFCNISCYSNKWEDYLGWQAKAGSKYIQKVSIPKWIMKNKEYSICCLRGLLETDGSIYTDRGYKMVNFVSAISVLAENVVEIIKKIGFKVNIYKLKSKTKDRYNVRVSKNVDDFIKIIDFAKN